MPTHNIALTATLNPTNPKEINVAGSGARNLPRGSGGHHFIFNLDDRTGHNVDFDRLNAADNSAVCPPPAGQASAQIVGVSVGPGPRTAEFVDKNDNRPRMDVSYEWTFTCDDKTINVLSFDPIISNGGRT